MSVHVLCVEELKDERSARYNSTATREEIASYESFEDRTFSRALRANNNDLRQCNGFVDVREGHCILQFVHQWD